MDLRDVLEALRTGWSLLVGGLLVGLAVAWVALSVMTPQYESSTRLFVSAGTTDVANAYSINQLSQQRVASYAELFTDGTLAEPVAQEVGPDVSPADISRKVSVSIVPNTVILAVTVTDTSPTRARDIAASLNRQFVNKVAALETTPGSGTSPIRVTVLTPPQVNSEAVSPDRVRVLVLGGAFGLLAGLVLALVRHRLDDTVKSGDDVRQATGSDLVGTVPADRRLRKNVLMPFEERGSAGAEALRAIRTTLQFSDGRSYPRSIVVTSADDGEGKTTLAVNLAAVLGQSGVRVLLVEADLRRPRLADRLELSASAGLAGVLSGDATWTEATQPLGDGAVTVLTAGGAPAQPSELLASPRMRSLLQDVTRAFDVVVIDCAPVLPVTDGAVVSALADACLMTARYGRTRRGELAAAAITVERLGARLIGVVLNGTPMRVAAKARYRSASAHASSRVDRSARSRSRYGTVPGFPPVREAEGGAGIP